MELNKIEKNDTIAHPALLTKTNHI